MKNNPYRDVVWNSTSGVTVSMTMAETFSPVMSEHNNEYYRVIMEQVDTTYTIHTGDNMTRILGEHELPKEIRVKLAMIKAYEPCRSEVIDQMSASTSTWEMYTWSPMDMYLNTFPSEFSDIGWRCRSDREFYCVMTTAETLDSLRGEPL